MDFRRITSSDRDWHSPFFNFVDTVFRPNAWHLWRDRGGWTPDYEVFALLDGGEIVSTIGRSRMRLVVHGEDRVGYQLGAVGTLKPYRRRGLARQLMAEVFDALDAPDQPIILFANESVVDFYPRFGFRRVPQRRSVARASVVPAAAQAARVDPADATERARLASLFARARPIRGPLSARDYSWIALWHLCSESISGFWLSEFDALVAVSAAGGQLLVHDVVAAHPFDLGAAIPSLIAEPVDEIEFCFEADDWWPAAEHGAFDDAEEPFFVRGAGPISGPVRLPDLAHT